MICPYCKTKLPDGSQFCSNCGQPISKSGEQGSASSSYWSTVEKEVARDEKIRTDAENEILEKQKKKNRTVIASLIALGIVVVIIFYFVSIYPSQQYETAGELLDNGEYHEAMVIYEDLGNYKDSAEQIAKCQEGITEQRYLDGIAEYRSGNYKEALRIFEELDSYKDCQALKYDCNLQIAQSLVPIYHWDFSDNLSEQNGLSSTAHGNTKIKEVLNGSIKSAAYFDGDGDYIECGRGINLTENFTFSILLCCQDVYKDYSAFFAKFEGNGGPYAFSINQGRVNLWITDEDGYHTEIESVTEIRNNEWYSISIVKEGDNFKLYIDGQLDSEDTISSVRTGEDLVTIGRQALMFSPEDQLQFTGYIGDVSIYEQTLSGDEILALYESKLPIESSGLATEDPQDTSTELPTEAQMEAPTEAPTEEIVQITEEHPFEQQYWIIFTEGTRNNRVEASTITSSLDADELFIIWNGSLTINNNSGATKCNQYYLDENGKWVKMGSYHRLSDRASNVIASNLDIYDKNGKLLVEKCFYQDLDWNLIEKYR